MHIEYEYDALGQLTRAKSVYVEEKYHFDGFGHPQGQASQRLGDRLLEHQGWRFQYDAHGNQIKAEGQGQEQSRRFNALNQLVEVQVDDQLAYYEYDALGRRSRKVTEAGVTEFLWQESQLIGEYHQGRYRWYFYQPESHIPSMLVQDGQCYFYQCDHLGTPLRLVTSQGEIVWQAHYETWGTAHIEIEQVTNPLRFQGQYYDAETGLHYNLARYYDPRTGRFIQPDPIGLLGGLNHYQYAPNPVMWVDPTGLCAKEDRPAITAGANDVEPQQQIFYAMGSGNYSSTLKTSSPTYQLNAGMSDVNQVNSDDIHLFLDGAGMMPAFGIIPDLANTLLYAAEGDYANALISAMVMVPIAGQGATAAKYGNKALNAATETAAKGSDNLTSAAKQLDETKVIHPLKARMKPFKVPCFKPSDTLIKKNKDNIKSFEQNYARQLKHQENGLNDLTIGEYLENRERY
ncbi:RHS domain-containing protein [Vibrio navarrensis]|nr:RHS domain-containing protein [Vibrio navarrensis]